MTTQEQQNVRLRTGWPMEVIEYIASMDEAEIYMRAGLQARQIGGLITTNLKLGFFEAYRIYSRRWSLEVSFKESKQNLGLGKYQMRNFSSQIAMTAITAMQYNLLSTARRFSDYETIGGLFKEATVGSVELTLAQRIWDVILEVVREIAECFHIDDEEIIDALLNKSDKLGQFIEIYQLKLAS